MMAVSNSASTSHSDVWKYISKESSSASATCTLCEKVLAYRGGMSNLREHLLRSHPREYHHEDKQQSTLDSIVKIRSLFPVKGKRSNGGFPHSSHHYSGRNQAVLCHCIQITVVQNFRYG